jgi:hypothetical protein
LATGRSVTLTPSKPDAIAIEKSLFSAIPRATAGILVARVEAD